MRVWDPPPEHVREWSRALFGSQYQLPVLAGIGRLYLAGDRVFTYQDLQGASSVQYPDVRNRVAKLVRAGLVEVVDDEWRHYFRAVESDLWETMVRLYDEVADEAPVEDPA